MTDHAQAAATVTITEERVRLIACMGWDACDDSDYAKELRDVVRHVLDLAAQVEQEGKAAPPPAPSGD